MLYDFEHHPFRIGTCKELLAFEDNLPHLVVIHKIKQMSPCDLFF